MSTSITLQLPDDIAQQLQIEAQKQNTTLENLLAQRLTQILHITPQAQNLSVLNEESLVSYLEIAEMFSFIREARQFERDYIQVPATPLALHIANLLVKHNLIHRVEVDTTQPYESMTLHLVQETPTTPKYSLDDLLNFPTNNHDLKQILGKLRDPDPNIRIQGVNALGDLYSEPA